MAPANSSRRVSTQEVDYYARQIIVPGIGASGQQKLLDSTCIVVGALAGANAAASYLRAAGVCVHRSMAGHPPVHCVVLANITEVAPIDLRRVRAFESPLVWYQMTARGLVGGIGELPALPFPPALVTRDVGAWPATLIDATHRLAGCDAAAAAIAAILGWPAPHTRFQLQLMG